MSTPLPTLKFVLPTAIFAGVLATAGRADASVITQKFTFDLTQFAAIGGGPAAPYNDVSGSFTLTYDPTVTYTNATSGFTLNSISPSFLGQMPVGFTSTLPNDNRLFVGGLAGGVLNLQNGGPDFVMVLNEVEPNVFVFQDLGGFQYLQQAGGYDYFSSTGTVSVTSVPEPATVGLLGLGAVTLVGRRRRQRA